MKVTSRQLRFLGVFTIISFYILYSYGSLDGKITILEKSRGVKIKNHTILDLPQESRGDDIKNHTTLDLANSYGYMLVLSYSDQITDGTTNLRSLLCLAKRMGGVRVVEPFIYGSYLGLNVSANWTRELRMTDVFDYSVWKQKTPLEKYGDFVPFQTFMESAPRKLVVVQYCTGLHVCLPCGHENIISKGRIFCELNGFQLAGHECLTYGQEKMLSLSSIETQLYSNYSKSEVVLMFDLYGGTLNQAYNERKGYRLFSSICSRYEIHSTSALATSQSIVVDADRYIQRYLKGLHYISIMIRMERVFIAAKAPAENRPTVAKLCLDNILKRLTTIKNETGKEDVFLTLDVGHYGTVVYRNYITEETKLVERHIEDFMSTIFKRNTTINEWEKGFVSISRTNHPGYISVLQKDIAAKGDVLVLVGAGSSYQKSAKNRYEKFHSMRKVYILDTKCQ